jgi:putative transposase
MDHELVDKIRELIQQFPTYGYRRIWAMLRYRMGIKINRKKVYRIMKLKRWLMHQRQKTPRPRVRGKGSVATQSNQRWAMDVTHINCGPDADRTPRQQTYREVEAGRLASSGSSFVGLPRSHAPWTRCP